MASFFIIGLVTAWSGFNHPMMYFEIDVMGFEPYHITKLILSGSLITMGLIMVKSPYITVGILSLLIGTSTFSFSLSELAYDIEGDFILDRLLFIPVLTIAVFNILNRYRFRGISIGILSISMLISSTFSGTAFAILTGGGFILSGFMLMILGITGLVKNSTTDLDEERDYGFEMVSISGFLCIGLYSILSSIETYATGYYVVSLTLSVIITVISVRGLLDGIIIEGVMMFMYGFSGIAFAIGRAFGGVGYVITDLGVACIIGICGLMLLLRKQRFLGFGCCMFSLMVIPGSLFEQGFSWTFGSLFLGPCLLYYAVSRWIYLETGNELLPMLE